MGANNSKVPESVYREYQQDIAERLRALELERTPDVAEKGYVLVEDDARNFSLTLTDSSYH